MSLIPNNDFLIVKNYIYDNYFKLSDLLIDKESIEYAACSFKINGQYVISRSSKITPKKTGQFVTLWKRINNGPIEPFNSSDDIDFFVVNVSSETNLGQFIFPKSALIKQGVISTNIKEGKRAIRVYPPWDIPTSKQAIKTQKWQLNYFLPININKDIDINKVKELYSL
jgi:hypothetical protein